jgi:ABC-type glycerol-3-phosphate transport system substrate-binding protein
MGGNSNVNRAVDIVYLLMLQSGVAPWSSDKLSPTFADKGSAGLSFYTSFANPTSANYNWNARSDYSIDAFANGRAAFLYSYSHTRDTILQKAPNLNFEVAPVPQRALGGTSINYANYFGEVVSKQSKNSAWAWHFLKFMTSQKELDKYYATTKQPSGRKDLIELQVNDPVIGVFANANLTAKSFYKPDQVKMDGIFSRMIDNIILKGMTVADALAQGQDQAAALVQP